MMNMKKIENLLDSAEFTQKMGLVDSPEALLDLFAQHGVMLTLNELEQMAKPAMISADSELSEDDLDCISGGRFWSWLQDVIDWLSKKNTKAINKILNS